jgi:hypothetical protein
MREVEESAIDGWLDREKQLNDQEKLARESAPLDWSGYRPGRDWYGW